MTVIDPGGDTIWGLWDGKRVTLPYSASMPVGSQEVAEHFAAPNAHLGWRAVPLLVELDAENCPHDWAGAGVNVNWGQTYECRICEGRTP